MPETETLNKIDYTQIEGKIWKLDEIAMWPASKFEDFFVFLDFFWVEGKMIATLDVILMLEEYSKAGSSCAEYVHRIGMYTLNGEMSNPDRHKYRMRLGTMYRLVQKYLKEKAPGVLSPITAKKYRFKVQYEWLRELYDDNGNVKFVSQNEPETVHGDVVPVSQETQIVPQQGPLSQRLLGAIEKVITVYEAIAESITIEDIKKMKATEKVAALNKLSYIHTNFGKMKTPVKFTQINIGKASKEELEKQMLDFGENEDDNDGMG